MWIMWSIKRWFRCGSPVSPKLSSIHCTAYFCGSSIQLEFWERVFKHKDAPRDVFSLHRTCSLSSCEQRKNQDLEPVEFMGKDWKTLNCAKTLNDPSQCLSSAWVEWSSAWETLVPKKTRRHLMERPCKLVNPPFPHKQCCVSQSGAEMR